MLRHLPPIVSVLVLLLVARQIYPYSSFNTPTVGDGFEIEVVATNLGGPTCLEWFDDSTLIVCDRDGGQIYALDLNMSKTVLVDDLDRPHDVAITDSNLFVSEAGKLSRYVHDGQLGEIGNKTTLISNVPTEIIRQMRSTFYLTEHLCAQRFNLQHLCRGRSAQRRTALGQWINRRTWNSCKRCTKLI